LTVIGLKIPPKNVIGMSKLMIGTGAIYTTGNAQIWDIVDVVSNSSCSPIENYPIEIFASQGVLMNKSTPVVCGGGNGWGGINTCYMYQKPSWVSFPSMLTSRQWFGMVPITSFKNITSQIFVTGGYKTYASEIFDGNSWSDANIPDLPSMFYQACLTQADDDTLIISGGFMIDGVSSSVSALSLKTFRDLFNQHSFWKSCLLRK